MINKIFLFCTFYKTIVPAAVIDGFQYKYKVDKDRHGKHHDDERHGHSTEGRNKVFLPDKETQVVEYSVTDKDSGFTARVYVKRVGIGKVGKRKQYRRYNKHSGIFTTTYPSNPQDTTVIPSPDTVTTPSEFMAVEQKEFELKNNYENEVLNSIKEISDGKDHVDLIEAIKVIPSSKIVTSPSWFRLVAGKEKLLFPIQ